MRLRVAVSFLPLFCLASVIPLWALSLFGEAETQVDFYIPEEGGDERYYSLINPGNLMGLNDIAYAMDLTFKVEDFSDEGGFTFWGSLEKDSDTELSENTHYKLDILRLSYDWNISDVLRFSLGRQVFLTGYGYGWNPMDLVNPLKDPSNPEQDMRGMDAFSLLMDRGGTLQTEGFLIVDTTDQNMIEYRDIQWGGSLNILLPLVELKLSALLGKNYAWGAGFLTDIGGAGFYGEACLREQSRVSLPGEAPDYILSEKDGVLYSFLGGLEYVFPSELSVTAEYFYNGEGLDQTECENYSDALEYYNGRDGYAPLEYYEIYRIGYFAEHYFLLNLFYPLYSLWSELNCSLIGSPDSGTLALQPEWMILPTGNLEIALGWSCIFSLDDSLYGEALFAPVNQAAYLNAVYHF